MLEPIKESLSRVNTWEATFGDFVIQGDKLIIPYYNIYIMDDDNYLKHIMPNVDKHLQKEKGKYIQYCYLVFEGVVGIMLGYDVSKLIDETKYECYGGVYYRNRKGNEFWIQYQQGYIYLEPNYQSSITPWKSLEYEHDKFFTRGAVLFGSVFD
jgi:hypothetical protein